MKPNLLYDFKKEIDPYQKCIEKTKNGLLISYYNLNNNPKIKLNREHGEYYTIKYSLESLSKPKYLIKTIKSIIKKFIKDNHILGRILIIGLGNSDIIPDSLGPTTIDLLINKNNYNNYLNKPHVMYLNPSVTSKTGIDTYNLIRLCVLSLNPDLIITIDSLETNNINNLCQNIEITNAGVIEGTYLYSNKRISNKTFNIPIISIGIPFIYNNNNIYLTSLNVKENINKSAKLISDILSNII